MVSDPHDGGAIAGPGDELNSCGNVDLGGLHVVEVVGMEEGEHSAPQPPDLLHAVTHEAVTVDLEPDADPPKILVIGPDRAGNILEVIVLALDNDRLLAVHAMKLRRLFYELLPGEEGH